MQSNFGSYIMFNYKIVYLSSVNKLLKALWKQGVLIPKKVVHVSYKIYIITNPT